MTEQDIKDFLEWAGDDICHSEAYIEGFKFLGDYCRVGDLDCDNEEFFEWRLDGHIVDDFGNPTTSISLIFGNYHIKTTLWRKDNRDPKTGKVWDRFSFGFINNGRAPESPKLYICSSYDLFNFGCKCGGS